MERQGKIHTGKCTACGHDGMNPSKPAKPWYDDPMFRVPRAQVKCRYIGRCLFMSQNVVSVKSCLFRLLSKRNATIPTANKLKTGLPIYE